MNAEEIQNVILDLRDVAIRIAAYPRLRPDRVLLDSLRAQLAQHRREMEAAETQPRCSKCGDPMSDEDAVLGYCTACHDKRFCERHVKEEQQCSECEGARPVDVGAIEKRLKYLETDRLPRYLRMVDKNKKRIDEIEQKHDDLSRFYETHIRNGHTGWRR